MGFSKSWNSTRQRGSCIFSFTKNSFVQINSKLSSKTHDITYTNRRAENESRSRINFVIDKIKIFTALWCLFKDSILCAKYSYYENALKGDVPDNHDQLVLWITRFINSCLMEIHDVSAGRGRRDKNLLVCIVPFIPPKCLVSFIKQQWTSKPLLLLIPFDIFACAY